MQTTVSDDTFSSSSPISSKTENDEIRCVKIRVKKCLEKYLECRSSEENSQSLYWCLTTFDKCKKMVRKDCVKDKLESGGNYSESIFKSNEYIDYESYSDYDPKQNSKESTGRSNGSCNTPNDADCVTEGYDKCNNSYHECLRNIATEESSESGCRLGFEKKEEKKRICEKILKRCQKSINYKCKKIYQKPINQCLSNFLIKYPLKFWRTHSSKPSFFM